MTDNGTVGKRFVTASPRSIAELQQFGPEHAKRGFPHVYEVTDRLEASPEVLVRAKFIEVRGPEKTLSCDGGQF